MWINHLNKANQQGINIIVKPDWTETTLFLFPSLKLPVDLLLKFGFKNSFLGDKGIEHDFKDCIYLLFRYNSYIYENIAFENKLRQVTGYVYDYDSDINEAMFVFKIDEKWLNELKQFKLGRYSKFSTEYIKNFLRVGTIPFQVCNKDSKIKQGWEHKLNTKISKDSEYWSKPNMKKEIYRFTQLKLNLY